MWIVSEEEAREMLWKLYGYCILGKEWMVGIVSGGGGEPTSSVSTSILIFEIHRDCQQPGCGREGTGDGNDAWCGL